jgi:3-dehydroquinate dehydratase-2
MKVLIINGPNLNLLGERDKLHYGSKTLADIQRILLRRAEDLGVELEFFQSNSEGEIIDFVQQESKSASGIIINPGALTHYGLSLRDALSDCSLPIIEVHLSNIYSREEWRKKSVIAPICKGQIGGFSHKSYICALMIMASELKGEDWD